MKQLSLKYLMTTKKQIKYWLVLAFMSCFLVVNAQTREELEKKRQEKLKDIEFTQKLIDATTEQQKKNINYLVIIKRQINNRKNLINTLTQEVNLINKNISSTEQVIESLQGDLIALKAEYEKMLLFAYKNRNSYDYMIYVFASNSINQAWKRIQFIKYYAEIRKNQIDLIEKTKNSLNDKMSFLNKQIVEKEELKIKLNKERDRLLKDKYLKNEVLQELQEKEGEYKKKLERDKKLAREIDKAIEEIINKEVAKADETSPALSVDFETLKAKFNWPVEGIISSSFGRHEHPTIKNVYINNNGIDIRTEANALVKCIHAGKVIHVVFIPGANNAIIIKHGNYYTVYKNLIDVAVKPGDLVRAGQELGKVYFDEKKGAAELHFEVRKNTEKLNPVQWLKKS